LMFMWYCLDLDNFGQQIVIPMPRTQSRTSRQWMSAATSERIEHPEHGLFTPPLFFRSYTLGSVLREDGENDWYVFTFEAGPTVFEVDPDGNLMAAAQRFSKMLESGEIRADASSFADEGQGVGGRGQAERRGGDDEEM
jgi:hypothetical protein